MGIFALLCAIALGAFFTTTGHHSLAAGANSDQQNVVAIQDTGQAGHVAIANSFLDFDGHQMAMQRQPQISGAQIAFYGMGSTSGCGVYTASAMGSILFGPGNDAGREMALGTLTTFDYGHVAWRDTGYQIAAIAKQFTFNLGPQTRGPTIAYMDGQSGGLGHRLALTRLQEGAQHLQV
jgi:hypothetical protein